MKSNFTKYLFLVFVVIPKIGKSQTKFTTTIIFPKIINLKKIEIEYDNGKETVPFKINNENNEIKISGFYYSKYVVLTIYNSFNDNQVVYAERYFLGKNSLINIFKRYGVNKKLDSVKLINAVNIKKMGQNRFNLFAKNETTILEKFLEGNAKLLDGNDSLMAKYAELDNNVKKKKLEFIKNNKSLYYSLWLFKRDFISNTGYNPDSLLNIYNDLFSKKYQDSFEETVILSVLNGRINALKGKMAPLFSVSDYKGNIISLEKLRNKFVLLNFWATWCVPCLNEMPVIDSINKKYSDTALVIISVSKDVNTEKCIAAIEKFRMDWVNIINNASVINAYGNNRAIPQLYLIDKGGKIIYSREEDNDYDLKKLSTLIELLLTGH